MSSLPAGLRHAQRVFRPEQVLDWPGRVPDRLTLAAPLLPRILLLGDPEDARAVFTERDGELRFGEGLRRLAPHEPMFGRDALDVLDRPEHTHVRRVLTAAFHGDALRGYERGIVAVTERHLRDFSTGVPVSFRALCRTLARDVITETVFGVREPSRAARLADALDRLDDIIESLELTGRFVAAVLRRGRWAPYPRIEAVHATIADLTREEIADRRARGHIGESAGRADCLARFLAFTGEDALKDELIVTSMRVLVIAGWATTANTLAWLAERLSRAPAALERCLADADAGTHGYLTAAIQETLRMRPPVPFTVRYAVRDAELGTLRIPRGTAVAVDIERIHHRPEIYPDPSAFRPERFLEQRPGTYSWIPFGGGVHRCIGAGFALTEARLILAALLQRFTFAPIARRGERSRRGNLITAPAEGATVTLLRR
ncbi:MAG TPA: cytochrome P450, partial [Solirubrobacteraceae bacterium]|nr:cytochrome P450 [Solirubrobacteraceae bacterium]